jgi:superfamily II DNA/RNA helicase
VNIPRPVVSFAHFGFDERLMKTLRKSEFTTPTPIQSQVRDSFFSILISNIIFRLFQVH